MNHEKKIVLTKDGSYTLRIDALKESYHSLHGALTESEFIYLNHGLHFWQEKQSRKAMSDFRNRLWNGFDILFKLLRGPKESNWNGLYCN
jgi:hypothetical protein